MADSESFSDDITALWGAPGEDLLEPPRPLNKTSANGHAPDPVPSNGSHAEAAADPRDSVARLADALAGHRVDVVRSAELHALRAEMEETFTHQLAVALYELLSASNDRFASVEDHMDRRLQDVAARVELSVHTQGDRLAAAIEAQQRSAAELVQSVHDELVEISDRFRGPVEAMAPFQREMRHEVGRLGDLVAGHSADAVRRSEAGAERVAAVAAQLSEQQEGLASRDAAATEELEQVTGKLASVQSDVAALHDAITELRDEVAVLGRRKGRARSLWGRAASRNDAATTSEGAAAE